MIPRFWRFGTRPAVVEMNAYGKGRSPDNADVGSVRADRRTPFRAEANLTTDRQRASSVVMAFGTASAWLWTRIARTMTGAIVTVNRTNARTSCAIATEVPDEFPHDVPGLHAPHRLERAISGHHYHDLRCQRPSILYGPLSRTAA
jgi:hypothetical protein